MHLRYGYPLRKVVISEKWKKDPQGDGTPYFNVQYFIQFEEGLHYVRLYNFDVDELTEAAASCIVKNPSKKHYTSIRKPKRYLWNPYKICITETVRCDDDHNGIIINYLAYTMRAWRLDYQEYYSDWGYALIHCVEQFSKIREASPSEWTFMYAKQMPHVEQYPIFKWQNYYFKTTYYLRDSKCVCGKALNGYYDKREDSDEIKVEVWNAELFSKDTVHVSGKYIIYDLNLKEMTERECALFGSIEHMDEGTKYVRQRFPFAKYLNAGNYSANLHYESKKSKTLSVK